MDRQQEQEQVTAGATEVYQHAILERLLEHYLKGTTMPGPSGKPLSAALCHQLYRYAVAEGYGK